MDLYDLVELREALPEENLPAEAVGTIVHVFHRPQLAYEVEFTDEDGRTLSSVALTPDKLRRISNDRR
ncbi:DUF4926 domain-containing protein [Micromonospora sp. DR5-3]|uniref:DUF4926 domain-containing protein n=1 Tax=unclassified Micromonospora TaxID=2617518 RepID=UPI0011D5E090|nr:MULTISPECIES: DUF4926 domain-containing protein [unclassified Micromonospora]MCW3820406.1 DUF4926 domain-containing protein [Micromonospora sp. DR5-3]TYC19426.1 DUF4926 domain-containing protein [Micromonospora sp. MP36]